MSLEINAICEMCKKSFKVSSGNVEVTTFIANDGNIVYITWYKCPDCGNIHYVQIDDDDTRKLLGYTKVALKQAMLCKEKNKTLSKKMKKRLDDSKSKLSNARLDLMKKYNETIFKYVSTKEEVKIRFSL